MCHVDQVEDEAVLALQVFLPQGLLQGVQFPNQVTIVLELLDTVAGTGAEPRTPPQTTVLELKAPQK